MVSKYHRGQFGSRHVSRDKLLKFDRFYMWDEEFRKLYVKEGHIYQAGEVKICGFLHKKHYPQIKTRKSKKLVLYPFEHFADYDAMLQLLKWFEKRSYRILIKSRPDMKNYGHFPGLDFQLVEDFTQDHFENALCIVGSTTTMLFDLSVIGLPVVLPKYNGLKMLSGISLPNSVYVCTKHEQNVIDGYFEKLDAVFSLISDCEAGRSIDDLLDGPVCHSGFKRLI